MSKIIHLTGREAPFAQAGRDAAIAAMLLMASGACLDLAQVELTFDLAFHERGHGADEGASREAFFHAFADEMERQRFNVAAVGRGVDPEPQGSA